MANIAGTTGSDNLTGTTGNDDIRGTSGTWVFGIFIPSGTDTGDDTLRGKGGNDKLYGYGGNDWLYGDTGNDTLRGGDGNDTLEGGSGKDSLYGEAGNDTFKYTNGQNGDSGEIVDGGAGHDRVLLDTFSGTDYWFGLRGVDFTSIEEIEFWSKGTVSLSAEEIGTVNGLSSTLLVDGYNNASSQEIIRIYMDTETIVNISGWQFQDWGGQNELIYIYGDNQNESITGSSMKDIIYGNDGVDWLFGKGGNDTLYGGNGNDILKGGTGNDILEGGAGKDRMEGEAGNDHIRYSNGQDGTPGEVADGGSGTDALYLYNSSSATDKVFNLADVDFVSIEQLAFASGGRVILPAEQIGGSNGLSSTLQVTGRNASGHTETIDIWMMNDTYVDVSGWRFSGWGSQGELVRIYGDGDAETIIGSSQNDLISSNGGNDTIEGGAGKDTLLGGTGNDTFKYTNGQNGTAGEVVDGGSGNDRVVVHTSSGTDFWFDLRDVNFTSIEEIEFWSKGTVALSAKEIGATNGLSSTLLVDGFFNSGATEYIRIYMGSDTRVDISGWRFQDWSAQNETIYIFGDNSLETITGSSQRDEIDSGRGRDTVRGEGGNDSILTQAGNDTAYGGTGNDYLHGGNGHDELYGDDGNDEVRGGKKNDTVIGGAGNDTLYGNKGKDSIIGGTGDDVMSGGPGNDTLTGNSGNDELTGGSGRDRMTGDAGNDILNGGAGEDILWGGGGNDKFVFEKRSNTDRVKDFQDNIDKLDLSSWGFANVSQALAHATQVGAHVKFDFTSISGAGPNDILWVENITRGALTNDILV